MSVAEGGRVDGMKSQMVLNESFGSSFSTCMKARDDREQLFVHETLEISPLAVFCDIV